MERSHTSNWTAHQKALEHKEEITPKEVQRARNNQTEGWKKQWEPSKQLIKQLVLWGNHYDWQSHIQKEEKEYTNWQD